MRSDRALREQRPCRAVSEEKRNAYGIERRGIWKTDKTSPGVCFSQLGFQLKVLPKVALVFCMGFAVGRCRRKRQQPDGEGFSQSANAKGAGMVRPHYPTSHFLKQFSECGRTGNDAHRWRVQYPEIHCDVITCEICQPTKDY
jgi:hypothetical protein